MKSIDTANMCSHLQRKLFDADGEYSAMWYAGFVNKTYALAVRMKIFGILMRNYLHIS